VSKKLLMGIAILCGLAAVIGGLAGNPSTQVQPANDAQEHRRNENFATKAIGEQAIRSMLKDPDSGVFTQSKGRLKDQIHVACGHVNAKNSFGAMAGASPWLVIVETKTAMIATSENAARFNPLWNKYCVGPEGNPPDSFRGIKWDSALPPTQKLRETALMGCGAIVEQKNFTDTPPCSHVHIDKDDIELFTQRRSVPSIFDVPVSEQLLMWSHGKFWSGQVFIKDYKEADLAKLRMALMDRYGEPTFANEQLHLTKWTWTSKKLDIILSFHPVAKPSLDSDNAHHTSISLSLGKIE
jgi:hypothetical protein